MKNLIVFQIILFTVVFSLLDCNISINLNSYSYKQTINTDSADDTNITPDPEEQQDIDKDGMPDSYENQYQGQVMFEDHFDDGTLNPAWVMKCMYWEETDGKLKSLPQVLPDFNYGHSGNGRGAQILLHEGDTTWTDYSYEFVYGAEGVSPEWNPHSLPIGFVMSLASNFRVLEKPASWNEPATTCYNINMGIGDGKEGDWKVSANHETYIPGSGWNANYEGEKVVLIEGNSSDINTGTQANHVRVLVKENHIYIWANGVFMTECEDPLNWAPYGGISFSGGTWESMGWYDDVIVRTVGLDPNIPDAHLDYDQDGLTNLEEYLNKTNPLVFNE